MEHLDAVVSGVGYCELPTPIHVNPLRRRKISVASTERAEPCIRIRNVWDRWRKYLDGVVPRVGNDSKAVTEPALGYGSRAAELNAVVKWDRITKPGRRRSGATSTLVIFVIPNVSYAVVAGVGDIDSVICDLGEVDRCGAAERFIARAGRSIRGPKGTVGAKELNAVVAGVSYDERAVGPAHIHILRRRELAGAVAACSKLEGKGAVGVEGLDAVVAGVGDVDHPAALEGDIHMDARRPVKLPVAVAAPAEPERKGAVGVEDLHAVVAGVGDVDRPVVQQDDAFRRREMPGGRRRLRRLAICGIRRHGRQKQRQRGNGGNGKRQGRLALRGAT